MNSEYSKNSVAWQLICDTLHIPESVNSEGVFHIDADQMKEISNREPRHLGKIDNSGQLPCVFRENDLNILPDTRGTYVIGHFDLFEKLDYENVQVKHASANRKFDTLRLDGEFSHETSAIMVSFDYGILDSIVDRPNPPLAMTRFGRTASGIWDFNVNGQTIHVNNAQLEMDGVFESDDVILNIEAKIGPKGDFLKRQLFYPYRYLRTLSDKPIINAFLTVSGDSIFTHLYEITNDNEYNSFKQIESYRFDLFNPFYENSVQSMIETSQIVEEPKNIPFPQADSMSKVFETVSFVRQHPGSTDAEIANWLAIDPRQGSYYGNACAYLGLFERYHMKGYGNTFFNRLSSAGHEFMTQSNVERNRTMIRLMARHKVFNICLKERLNDVVLKKPDVTPIMEKYAIGMNKGTPERRASTVIGWCNWVKSITEEKT